MIHAICLNPVLDRIYHLEGFRPGVKFKQSVPELVASGKGVNVAKVCKTLGAPVTLYAFVGGFTGAFLKDAFAKRELNPLYFDAEGETRETVNIIDAEAESETEIIEAGPLVSPSECARFLETLERNLQPGDIAVCSGIPFNGAPQNIYNQIAALCARKGAKCALDTNGPNLIHSMNAQYYAVKPNYDELLELTGAPSADGEAALCALMKRAMEQHADYMLLSLGGEGALLSDGDRVWRAGAVRVPVYSTIGSGDSCFAGFLTAMLRGEGEETALRLAMACGAANAMHPGVADFNEKDVQALFAQSDVKRIV